jgi:hypothetical protein
MVQRQFVLNGAEQSAWFLFLIAVAAAAVVCIALLYSYERRLIPRGLGFILLALRFTAVLLIFLVLLEPVLTWAIDRTRTGRVVVAVDLSESMETADKHASRAEKLRLARALGKYGNPQIDERIDRWIEAFENGQEPEWVTPAEAQDPDRAAQLAADRQDTLNGVFRDIEQIPRKDIARQLLTNPKNPILEQLGELALVELAVFAGDSVRSETSTLDELIARPPADLRTDASDLAKSITSSVPGTDDAPLAAVILLTDGRDNAHEDPGRLLAQVRAGGVPVYPVVIGSQERPKDLAVSGIDAPGTVYQNDHPVAKVTLRTAGYEGQPLTVELRPVEGQQTDEEIAATPPLLTQTVNPDGSSATVEFPLDADELGRRRFLVSTAVQPGETRDDNNSKPFAFHVVDDESDVLLLEGEARWEFRYLDAALKRDEHVKLEQVVFRQPYMGVLPDTFFPRTLTLPPDIAAATETPFQAFDCVIVGDVASHHLTTDGWKLIDRFVREEGGTLVLVAGKSHMPLAYNSPILDELLPVENLDVIETNGPEQTAPPLDRGFHLQLTPDGEAEAMLQFDPDEIENRRIWATLPGHMWGLRGVAKPGCTVWATALRAGEEPNLQAERENAVVVHQFLGSGQVLWIGIDSTWRWRHRIGDEYHHRFWGQLSRWAADFKATAGNEFVRFGPERPTIELGEDALFRARWTEQFLRRFPNLKARVEVTPVDDPDESPIMTVDLTPTETRPMVHEGRAAGLDSGEYRIRLVVEDADLGEADVVSEIAVTERVTTELSELTANRDLLQQIAAATGGRLFFPDQLDELPALFEGVKETEQIRDEISLWDHWLTLLLFCGLMGTEWVLRKLNGLP